MPKAPMSGYYAVRIGRVPGIYHSWDQCETQVRDFGGALYKKLNTMAEAIEFMAAKPSAARVAASSHIAPVASTSRAAVVPKTNVHTGTVQAARSIPEDEKDCDIVYCDGACKGNGQAYSIAGIGVWWGHGDPRNISERCPGDQTNNRAELIAIVRILETTPRLQRRLLIKTDSNYAIQCASSWIVNWTRNGFLTTDGKPVKNRPLIKYLAALLRVRRETSQAVKFKHVRGHVGIEGNEAADQLANLGSTKPVVQERDWEKLEKQALQTLKPVEPTQVASDKLAGLADTSTGAVVTPTRESTRQHSGDGSNATRSHTFPSLVPHETSPTRLNAPELTARLNDRTTTVTGRTFRPAMVVPSEPATTICKEELEVYASCLLSDEELSTTGKDGVFDSDF